MSVLNPRNTPTGSPCTGICSHSVGDAVCRGCGRTVEEVLHWASYTAEEKIAVKARIAAAIGRSGEDLALESMQSSPALLEA
ncbi:DUF1289 domain-containing protein [Geopseudomonas aromaticivorans]